MGAIRFKKYWKLFIDLFLALEDGKIDIEEAKRIAIHIIEIYFADHKKKNSKN